MAVADSQAQKADDIDLPEGLDHHVTKLQKEEGWNPTHEEGITTTACRRKEVTKAYHGRPNTT